MIHLINSKKLRSRKFIKLHIYFEKLSKISQHMRIWIATYKIMLYFFQDTYSTYQYIPNKITVLTPIVIKHSESSSGLQMSHQKRFNSNKIHTMNTCWKDIIFERPSSVFFSCENSSFNFRKLFHVRGNV